MSVLFHMPVKLCWGKNCIEENYPVLSETGKRALVVTGAHSAAACGALEDMQRALERAGVYFEQFDKIKANPTVESVYEGADAARAMKADFVVGIGGGSPMDAAKAIALLAVNSVNEEELFARRYEDKALPLILVPTTAGTGSEVTQYSILTNDKAKTKTSIAGVSLFAKAAFCDVRYLYTMSPATTVNTALDAFSHNAEGYLSRRANAASDALAEKAMGYFARVYDSLEKGELNEDDYEKLAYISILGGMTIAHTGTTAVHSMGYQLTYNKNIDHGLANGLLLGEFVRFAQICLPERTNKLLRLSGAKDADDLCRKLSRLAKSDTVFSDDELHRYSQVAACAKNIQNSIASPNSEEVFAIYRKSLKQ